MGKKRAANDSDKIIDLTKKEEKKDRRFSFVEIEFIKANMATMSSQQLAEKTESSIEDINGIVSQLSQVDPNQAINSYGRNKDMERGLSPVVATTASSQVNDETRRRMPPSQRNYVHVIRKK